MSDTPVEYDPEAELRDAYRTMEQIKLVVLRQQQAIELRKEQDINEEYALRQMQKKKPISSLPNADILEVSLGSKRVAIDLLTSEIDEVEPEHELGDQVKHLFKEFLENYRHGLARFRLLPFLETEEKVLKCADELNGLKLDYRDDLDELENLLGLCLVPQQFFCWLQSIKKMFDNLYSLRCGRDVLLKQWKQASVERDEIKKEVEEGEGDPLQKRVEDAFKEQGVSVPLS